MKKKNLLKGLVALSFLGLASTGVLTSCNQTSSSQPTADTDPNNPPSSNTDVESYSITVASVAGATVTADKESAEEGEKVTITISNIQEDKEFDSISINGGEVEATAVTAGQTYTFVMPDENITVVVTLKDKVYEAHAIKINEVAGFTVEFYKGTDKVTSAVYRDEIEVRITSTSTTQRVKSLTSNDVTLTEKSDNTYSFVMPDKEVVLSLEVENIPSHSLTATLGDGATGGFYVDGSQVTSALEGQEVTFHITIDDDYAFKSITWTGIELATTYQESYQFIMGTNDISVSVLTDPIPTYGITVTPVTGASVQVLADGVEVTEAKADEVITIKVESEPHYVFTDIQVNAGDVELTPVVEGSEYTFKMPSAAVTIDVSVQYVKQEFTISDIQIIEPGCTITNDVKEGDKFLEGSDVTITISSGDYNFDDYRLTVNGVKYETASESYSGYTFTFTMPSEDANLVIYPIQKSNENGTILSEIHYDHSLVTLYGLDVGEKYSLTSTYFLVVPKPGVYINSVDATYEDNTAISVYPSSANLYNILDYYGGSHTSFSITIDAEYVGEKTIEFVNDEHVTIDGLNKDTYMPGEDVYFNITPEDGYYYVDCEIITESGTTIDNEASSYSDYDIEFTMPKENVIITLNVGQPKHINVTESEYIESYELLDSSFFGNPITELAPGQTCYIKAYPIDGYEITNIYYQDGKACKEAYSDNTWSFEYPDEGDINITFEVAQRRKVTYDETSVAYEITGLATDYMPGDTVEFTVHNNLGYKITNISLDDKSIALTPSKYSYNKYSFEMPDKDVSIVVETEEVNTHTINFEIPDGITSLNIRDAYDDYIYSGDAVNVGETFTIGLGRVNTGFTLDSINLVTPSGTTPVEEVDGEYAFVMPDEDVTITAVLSEEEKHPITLNTTDERITYTIKDEAGRYGETFEQGYVGHEMNIEIRLNDPTGVSYLDGSKFEVKTASGADVQIEDISTIKSSTINVRFTMPDEEVIITPTVGQYELAMPAFVGDVEDYIVFKDGSSWGNTIDITQGVLPGKEICITNQNANFDAFEYSINVYLASDETKTNLIDYSYGTPSTIDSSYKSLYFTVPDGDFVVELTITPKA